MKTLGDKFQIGHGFREEDGTKIEPEEQPVKRTLESTATVDAGDLGNRFALPLSVTSEMSALEAADLLSKQCHLCEHWRQDEFQRDIPSIPQFDLDQIRAQCIDLSTETHLTDQDRAAADPMLAIMGKCMALSEMANADIYSHPQATCPATAPNGSELPFLFKPREKKTEAMIRDRMLRIAQGRGL